ERTDDAADQLFEAVLALRSANLAAEVLGDHDIGRLLRPEARDLDVALLEHDLTALVAAHRRPPIPFDLVERVLAGVGEEARKRQPRRGRRFLRPCVGGLGTNKPGNGSGPTALHSLLTSSCGLVGSALLHVLLRSFRVDPDERSHSPTGKQPSSLDWVN